jgi:hypothetical protein
VVSHRLQCALQVVLGVLGCPNLPQARLTADDGGAEAAGRVGESGIGVLFTAQQGCGAAVGPLTGAPIYSGIPSFHALPVRSVLDQDSWGHRHSGGHPYSIVGWYIMVPHGTALKSC